MHPMHTHPEFQSQLWERKRIQGGSKEIGKILGQPRQHAFPFLAGEGLTPNAQSSCRLALGKVHTRPQFLLGQALLSGSGGVWVARFPAFSPDHGWLPGQRHFRAESQEWIRPAGPAYQYQVCG